ncbi:MAG: portal protein, partial [Elioraea tepidiphila]
ALIRRVEVAERKRDAFAALMRDIYAFAMPERDAWNAYGYGADRQVKVYDSTAVIAAGRFANRLQQALFPPQQRWAMLALPPEMARRDGGDVARDLDAATELMFAHIHASNFDQTINEWALDLAAGVGCLLVENGRQASRRPGAPLLRFQAVPSGLVAFDEGPLGTVEGVFVRQSIPARLVGRTYPDATVPPRVAEMARRDPEKPVELLQATVYDPDEDRWRMVVAERGEWEVIAERRYRTSPWIVTRWSKSPGEAHGRGPLAAALPDIRTLNKLMELTLAAASLSVYGVWTVADDGVVNPAAIRIQPGAVIPVRSNGGAMGPSIAPLRAAADFGVARELMERLQVAIRQTMFDTPLPPEIQTGITATEIIERMRLFQQDTGAFGRLQADAVQPLVVRVMDILDEAGLLAGPRFAGLAQLLRADEVRVRAVSPLAQAQDRADVQAVMGFLAGATSLGPIGQDIIARGVALDRIGPWLAERNGVPPDLIPTAEELAERERAVAERQSAEAAMASPVLAQAVGNLAPAMAAGGA